MSGPDSPLRFPCRFPIKAIGAAVPEAGFAELVLGIVSRHAPGLDPDAVTVRRSATGKWLSVTVVVEAHSRDQLDAIYRDLSGHERVVMAL